MADAFKEGLKETGYLEGRNVAIEYRWAEIATIACGYLAPTWSAVVGPGSSRIALRLRRYCFVVGILIALVVAAGAFILLVGQQGGLFGLTLLVAVLVMSSQGLVGSLPNKNLNYKTNVPADTDIQRRPQQAGGEVRLARPGRLTEGNDNDTFGTADVCLVRGEASWAKMQQAR